jgi:hypothetical protein
MRTATIPASTGRWLGRCQFLYLWKYRAWQILHVPAASLKNDPGTFLVPLKARATAEAEARSTAMPGLIVRRTEIIYE